MGKSFEPGQRLGAYKIVRPLGKGGMGEVYEAEHVGLGIRRALKVFSTEGEHYEYLRKRFVRESRMLADLDHPRIVRVYDFAIDEESGAPYFAMDLVASPTGEPQNLMGASVNGADEEQVASWFRDICEGLAYIHAHGVVHRDISLDNILLDKEGRAVITDFGIARITGAEYCRKINVTVTIAAKDCGGMFLGKPSYMAPELKAGEEATPASDAYALGVLVFRLLTGFWFESDRRENAMEMLAGMKYDWTKPLSRVLDDDPKARIPEDGSVATIPELLVPAGQHGNLKRYGILAVVLIALIGIGLAIWAVKYGTKSSRSSLPAQDPGRLAPADTASQKSEFQKRSEALKKAMENGIMTPKPSPSDANMESGK